jgi:hypothetical protein
MRIGTNLFASEIQALGYYRKQCRSFTLKDIKEKRANQEIAIGPPTLKPGQTLVNIDGRWHIEEN